MNLTEKEAARFWTKVRRAGDDECWEWQAGLTAGGYGQFKLWGKTLKAHRVAWSLARGPLDSKQCLLHSCDNPRCVNPNHLWIGTRTENMEDKVRKGRQARGERHAVRLRQRNLSGERNPAAKLDWEKVREIRRLAGTMTQDEIARRFGVSQATVQNVIHRRTWKEMPCSA